MNDRLNNDPVKPRLACGHIKPQQISARFQKLADCHGRLLRRTLSILCHYFFAEFRVWTVKHFVRVLRS